MDGIQGLMETLASFYENSFRTYVSRKYIHRCSTKSLIDFIVGSARYQPRKIGCWLDERLMMHRCPKQVLFSDDDDTVQIMLLGLQRFSEYAHSSTTFTTMCVHRACRCCVAISQSVPRAVCRHVQSLALIQRSFGARLR